MGTMVAKRLWQDRGLGVALSLAVAVVAVWSAPVGASAQTAGTAVPTFSADIAPILQKSCQACHNPQGIGPMSLITYEQARPWAPVIKENTQSRHMPPWHLDKSVGIQEFKNDISLTDEEIELIARWVDGGAPEGNRAEMPAALEFAEGGGWDGERALGRAPDVIVRSTPFDMPANSQDQWWGENVPFEGLPEDRWLMAAEFRPAYPYGQQIVHHGHALLGGKGVARYGVGKSFEIFPPDFGMLIPAGPSEMNWDIHYSAIDRDVPGDVVEVGLWFYPVGEEPQFESEGEVLFRADNPDHMRGQDILIPPHGYQVLSGTHLIDEPAVIHSIRAHMHTRGKTMTLEAIYPDGRREVLSQVNNYDHNWQNTYTFADESRPLLPAGTMVVITSVYDNTADNPINPDPDQWVVFGRRGPDEMNHLWIGISYIPESEMERLVSERDQPEQRAPNLAQVPERDPN